MSRILIKDEWYDKLAVSALYETEYERIIMQQARFIFPYHYCVPFKTLVYDEQEGAKADLALIEKGAVALFYQGQKRKNEIHQASP